MSFILKKGSYNNDLAVAEYFNDYFATVADDLASTFPPTKVEYNHRVRSRFGCFTPVTEEEIRSVIGKLKRSESIISDAISSNIVKECAEIVTPAITNIVNMSLEKGSFQLVVHWLRLCRCLNRVPPHSTHNYRPIYILSALSKIIEKIVKIRLLAFLEKCNILYAKQFGFRKKLGTSFAVNDMIIQIEGAKDARKKVAGVYIDLKKAFDTVNHELLLQNCICLVSLVLFCRGLSPIYRIDNSLLRSTNLLVVRKSSRMVYLRVPFLVPYYFSSMLTISWSSN